MLRLLETELLFYLFSHLSWDPWWQTRVAVYWFVGPWGWAPDRRDTPGTGCSRGSQSRGCPRCASWCSEDAHSLPLGSSQSLACCWDLGWVAERATTSACDANWKTGHRAKTVCPQITRATSPAAVSDIEGDIFGPPPRPCYLDGGDKSSRDVRAQAGRHGELGHVLLFLHCGGDALLTEELQAGDAMLHPHHVQSRAARQEEAGVAVAPAQRGYGALQVSQRESAEGWCKRCSNHINKLLGSIYEPHGSFI